jgi:hypothetical protein
MQRTRNIYTAVIRAAIGYGAPAFHNVPKIETRKPTNTMSKDLGSIQNTCLRIVSGAYKATPIRQLETETYIPPIDLWLTSRVAVFHRRLRESGMEEKIKRTSRTIRTFLRRRRTRSQQQPKQKPHGPRENAERALKWLDDGNIRARLEERWTERWNEQSAKAALLRRGNAATAELPPDPHILKLHTGLHKAESSLLIQLRTEKIGLRAFLVERKVPTVPSPQCECGQGRETGKHIILYCLKVPDEKRAELRDKIGHLGVDAALRGRREAGIVSKWFMSLGRLEQFKYMAKLIQEWDTNAEQEGER